MFSLCVPHVRFSTLLLLGSLSRCLVHSPGYLGLTKDDNTKLCTDNDSLLPPPVKVTNLYPCLFIASFLIIPPIFLRLWSNKLFTLDMRSTDLTLPIEDTSYNPSHPYIGFHLSVVIKTPQLIFSNNTAVVISPTIPTGPAPSNVSPARCTFS